MRYVVQLTLIRRTDDGQLSSSYRTHIVTLSNEDAFDSLLETIKKGKTAWRKDLKSDDVLESNDTLDVIPDVHRRTYY